MAERRQDESITAFTIRRMQIEVIEDCIKTLENAGHLTAARVLEEKVIILNQGDK